MKTQSDPALKAKLADTRSAIVPYAWKTLGSERPSRKLENIAGHTDLPVLATCNVRHLKHVVVFCVLQCALAGDAWGETLKVPEIFFSIQAAIYESSGAGICCSNASPTISGCTITDNTTGRFGGGICCLGSSSPKISSCTAFGNTATDGWGGGLSCHQSSAPTVTDCVFSQNSAGFGAGIACLDDSVPALVRCDISGNEAAMGGGLHTRDDSAPTFTDCTIHGNSAEGPASTAIDADGNGTAVVFANGEDKDSVLDGFTVMNGSASKGGGIACNGTSPTIRNCTIKHNNATGSVGNGGGIYCSGADPIIINSILWGNEASGEPNEIAGNGSSLSDCVVAGGWGAGAHNLSDDPLLQPLGNYGGPTPTMSLSFASPAIDEGANGSGIPAADQRGFPREAAPDIGACEFTPVRIESDLKQPYASLGSMVNLVEFSDHTSPTYQWFEGDAGDENTPITNAAAASYITPSLVAGISHWVRISYDGGASSIDSVACPIEVRSTYEEWADYYSLETGERGYMDNPTGDGISNLAKYTFGFDPTIPCRLEDRVSTSFEPSQGILRFLYVLSKTPRDLSYHFEWSPDLLNWSSTGLVPLLTSETAATTTWEVRLPCTSWAAFLRLNAEFLPP